MIVFRLIDRLAVGGPAQHVVWLTDGLRSCGFETVLATGIPSSDEGDMDYLLKSAGIRPVRIREMGREVSWRDCLVVLKLLRELFRAKPDIIHTHKSKAGAAGRLAATAYRWLTPSAIFLKPRKCWVIHTFHGHIFSGYYGRLKTGIFIWVERFLARYCTDLILTISPLQQKEILHQFRIGRLSQHRIVPLGIEFPSYLDDVRLVRQDLGIGAATHVIGFTGRLCEIKNIPMLIRIVEVLIREGTDARLLIVGDGPLRKDLETMANDCGLTQHVIFLGFRRDMWRLYHSMDIVALTSRNEGTPLSLIEAMACRKAVIASEVGGVADLMGELKSSTEEFCIWDHGITVSHEDIDAFCAGVKYLIQRPDLRNEMGARAQSFVRTHLSKERLVVDIANLYRQLR